MELRPGLSTLYCAYGEQPFEQLRRIRAGAMRRRRRRRAGRDVSPHRLVDGKTAAGGEPWQDFGNAAKAERRSRVGDRAKAAKPGRVIVGRVRSNATVLKIGAH